jgi:alpha-amylase
MMQYFSWYLPPDASLWRELATKAPELADAGFTSVWIPPCSKGCGGVNDVGYGVYDLFDLGEFDQKGATATKYGTRDELIAAIRAAQSAGLQVYADIVFNHMDGADELEEVWVQEVDRNDRNRSLSDWHPIHAWTRFTFEGRGDKYSTGKWGWWCFDSISYNADTQSDQKLYRVKDKQFETAVSHEHGNYDYLLANDLDMGVDFVRGELTYWGEWFLQTTGVDGFRLDACKHIRTEWFPGWLGHLRSRFGKELFAVGEYWSEDLGELRQYIADTAGAISLFDVPLHYHFYRAGREGSSYDLRRIFDGTLVQADPFKAVTFVENHDTQPCRSLVSPVEPWFKPLAYALILLRQDGYPCVFHADYYGSKYDNCDPGQPPVVLYSHRFLIDLFLRARRDYGFGPEEDYFDHPNVVGWTRLGNAEHPGSMAVALSNGDAGSRWMNMYRPNRSFYDATGHFSHKVTTNGDGWGEFPCPASNVSVWLQE